MERSEAGKTRNEPSQTADFSAVYAENYALVYGYMRARIFQSHDVEDLCQEVFLRVFRMLKRYDESVPIRFWLLGIARNVLREYVRRVSRRKEVAWAELCLDLEETVEAESPYDDILPLLPICTLRLTESAREAIRLQYMAGLGLQTVAERLNRSLGAVKVLLHRARQFLRRCIQSHLRGGAP